MEEKREERKEFRRPPRRDDAPRERHDNHRDEDFEDEQGGRRRGGMKRPRRMIRRKVCRFCTERTLYIDYKNYRLLREFLTERGKIIPRRISNTCAKHQRMLTSAIKRARDIALLAYTRR